MVRKIRSMGNMVTSEYYSLIGKRGAGKARSGGLVRNVVKGTSRASTEQESGEAQARRSRTMVVTVRNMGNGTSRTSKEEQGGEGDKQDKQGGAGRWW